MRSRYSASCWTVTPSGSHRGAATPLSRTSSRIPPPRLHRSHVHVNLSRFQRAEGFASGCSSLPWENLSSRPESSCAPASSAVSTAATNSGGNEVAVGLSAC